MPYLWTDQTTVQSYLDGEGTIVIRTDDVAEANDPIRNFSQAAAMRFENESVYEIATLLSLAFEPDTSDADMPASVVTETLGNTPLGFKSDPDTTVAGTLCPQYLQLITGKLTASKIGTVRLGASVARLPNWVRAYKNEVYAQLQRWILNAETATIAGLTLRSNIDIAEILIKMKTREHSAEELED